MYQLFILMDFQLLDIFKMNVFLFKIYLIRFFYFKSIVSIEQINFKKSTQTIGLFFKNIANLFFFCKILIIFVVVSKCVKFIMLMLT